MPLKIPNDEQSKQEFTILWNSGITYSELCKHYQCSDGVITSYRRKLGLKPRIVGLTSERRDVLTKAWNDGVSLKAIAHQLGLGVTAIRDMCRKLELARRSTKGKKGHTTNLMLGDELRAAASKRAFSLNMSMAKYIRYLVKRDVGMSIPETTPRVSVHRHDDERVIL